MMNTPPPSRRRAIVISGLIAGVALLLLAQRSKKNDTHTLPTATGSAASSGMQFYPHDAPSKGDPNGTISGIVLADGGQPIEGASLTVWSTLRREPGSYHNLSPRHTASTGPDGRFVVETLAEGEYSLSASAPGYSPAYLPLLVVRDDGATKISISLRPGGYIVHGVVRDIGAGTIAGAVVGVMKLLEGESPPILQEMKTADDGAFAVSLAAGRYVLTAKAGGYATNSRELIVQQPTEADLVLLQGGRLAGRVVSSSAHQPVAAAEVALIAPPGLPGSLPIRTDSGGRFVFESLEPGAYRVWSRTASEVSGELLVNVGPGDGSKDVELELRRGATIAGRVVDPAGMPLENVRLSVRSSFIQVDRPVATTTRSDGTFEIGGIIPGALSVSANAPGRVAAAVSVEASAGVNSVKDIVLAGGATLRGKVTADRPFETLPSVTLTLGSGDATSVRKASVDESGAFTFADVPSGIAGSMLAIAQGVGSGKLEVAALSPGETRDSLIALRENGSWISGTVKKEDGSIAPGWVIVGHQNDATGTHRAFNVVADTQGIYRLGPFQKGRVALCANPPATFDTSAKPLLSVDLGEDESKTAVDIVVSDQKAELSGIVVDEAGHPVPGAVIIAAAGSHGPVAPAIRSSVRTESQVDGRFRLQVVGAAPFTVWGRHADYGDAHLPGVGASEPLTVRLETAGRIVGTLSDERGPISSYELTVIRNPKVTSDQPSRPTFSFMLPPQRIFDPHGSFELRGLSKGVYALMFEQGGTTIATSDVEVGDDAKMIGPLSIVVAKSKGGSESSPNN